MKSIGSRKFDGLGEILFGPTRLGCNRITGEREGDDARRERCHVALGRMLDIVERNKLRRVPR
jgi:hypothetical protein